MSTGEGDGVREHEMRAVIFAITTAHDLQGKYSDELSRLAAQGRTWEQIWEELGIEADVSGTPSSETRKHILSYMAYGHKESLDFPRAPVFDGCVPLEILKQRESMINAAHMDDQKTQGVGFYGQTELEREEHSIKGIMASGHFPETQEELAYIEQLLSDPNYITSRGYINVEAITAAVNATVFNGESVRSPHAMTKIIYKIRQSVLPELDTPDKDTTED